VPKQQLHNTVFLADDSDKGIHVPLAKGRKLIIAHAGGECGFFTNALIIFKSNSKIGEVAQRKTYPDFASMFCNLVLEKQPFLPPGTGQTRSPFEFEKKSVHDWLIGRNIPSSVG
jgi:hypothetical protein